MGARVPFRSMLVQQMVMYRLSQAARAQRTRAAAELARIGLYPGQDSVLRLLAEEDGRTMGAVADALGIRPPTVTKMVSRLAASGLVERRQVDGDQRKASVHLTPAGRAKLGEIEAIWDRIESRALSGIESGRSEHLRGLLEMIETNLVRPGR